MLVLEIGIQDQHICASPDWMSFSARRCEVGSLWNCDDCGREQIKMTNDNDGSDWRYTVEVLDKRVQNARGRKNAK